MSVTDTRLLGGPFIGAVGLFGGSTIYQNATLQCVVLSTVPETVTTDWSTTALSANISNQEANHFGDVVTKLLHLTSLDPGYCGEYTCTVTDSDMMPTSTSTYLSVGACL